MPSMIELLLQSEGASPLAELSSRFGLSKTQTRQAVEALAPALSIGLKRNTASPMGAGAFIEALSTGRHAQYVDQPSQAVSDDGIKEGNKILGHLLGSKKVSRAVTAQAAQATGLGQNTMKQMLPMLASMAMGSMFKGAKKGSAGGGILGQILEGVLAGGAARGGSAAKRGSGGGDNPLGKMFEDMLAGREKPGGLRTPQRRRQTVEEENFDDIFDDGPAPRSTRSRHQADSGGGDVLGDMLDKFLDGEDEEPQMEAQRPRRRSSSGGSLGDLFGDMFDTGKEADDGYNNGLESIFDNFVDKRR